MVRRTCLVGGIVVLMLACAGMAGRAQGGAMPRAAKTAKVTVSTPVNLNTATQAELEGLPGIGPAAAARILEYRQKSGGFKKVEDLMNVKGIGEKSFLKLKPLVTVTPARTSER